MPLSRSHWLAVAALVALALAFLLAPWPLLVKLQALGFGLDPQRPAHSFFLGGVMMPVEARKVGIYAGFGLAAAWLVWRAPRAVRLGPAGYPAALLGIAVMGLDGTNALLYDLRAPHLYAPRLDLRLGTGLLCGLAMAALLVPVWAGTAWRAANDVLPARLFVVPALLSLGLFVGLVTEQAWLLLPASLVASLGLVGVVGMLNAVVLLVVTRRDGRAAHAVELLPVVAVAAWLAVLELLFLAGLRFALIGTTPLP